MFFFFDGEEHTNKNRIFDAEPSELVSVDSAVVLEKYEPTVSLKKVEPEDVGFEITLTSQQDPVEVLGQNTQASDVIIWGNHAIVSYNTAGEVFNGAIQWVSNFVKDSTDKNNSPEIEREVHLEGYDVNVIFLEGANLYVGGAVVVNDQVRSFLSYFKVNKGEISELLANMVYYDSYGVTSVVAIDEGFLVSVGADSGGVHLVNSETLVSEKFWAEEDVRSLHSLGGDHYLLSGTTDSESEMANLKSIDPASNDLTVAKEFSDFASDYQRAEIDVFEEDYLAVAIGQGGFEIWDPSNAFNKEWEYVLPAIDGYKIHANGVASEAG